MTVLRGQAGVTHCGKCRYLTTKEGVRFDVMTTRLVCTEKPHSRDQMHYHRFSGLEWSWDGDLRRREATR